MKKFEMKEHTPREKLKRNSKKLFFVLGALIVLCTMFYLCYMKGYHTGNNLGYNEGLQDGAKQQVRTLYEQCFSGEFKRMPEPNEYNYNIQCVVFVTANTVQ